MPRAAPTSFIGRAALRAELTTLLDEAASGAGAAALLYGEAGIGKTRTLRELAVQAAERDFAWHGDGASSWTVYRRSGRGARCSPR